jgi:hypothetical protein
MKIFRFLLAGASLLGLALVAEVCAAEVCAAQPWPAPDEIVGSVCGACAPGQSPAALELELQYTQMHAHDPSAQRTVIVNQPLEIQGYPQEAPISARY